MNYFAHGIAYLSRPYYLAGTSLPDWMSVADRRIRFRPRQLEEFLKIDPCPTDRDLAEGIGQHFHDDDWFHRQPAFYDMNSRIAKLFREVIGPDDGFRPGFLGHITTEMLLDRYLIEQVPDRLDDYYDVLANLDPEEIQHFVNRISPRTTDRLSRLLPRFIAERFLKDYRETAGMLFRLNQVMNRVKLPQLPNKCIDVLEQGFHWVADSHAQLLPSTILDSLTINPSTS